MEQPPPQSSVSSRRIWLDHKARELGFGDIYDCLVQGIKDDIAKAVQLPRGDHRVTEANARVARQARDVGKFVMEVTKIAAVGDPRFQLSLKGSDISVVAGVFGAFLKDSLSDEIQMLCRAFNKPAVTYLPRNINEFSFDKLQETIAEHAPGVWALFKSLFVYATNADKSQADSPTLEEVVMGRDYCDDDEDSDGEEAEAIEVYINKKVQRYQRNSARDREMIAAFRLAICCNARTREANYVQGIMGYFFNSSITGKRVVAMMNKLGVSTSYQSVNHSCVSIAEACREEYQRLANERPWILCADNINFMARVRQLIMNRTGFQENKIAAYVMFPQYPDGSVPKFLTRDDIDHSAALKILPEELLLTEEDFEHFKITGSVHLFRVLNKYLKLQMTRQRQFVYPDPINGKPKVYISKPPRIKPIKVLNHEQPSKLFTLPVLGFAETRVEEMMKACAEMIEELGQSDKGLEFMVAMISGDFLTVRNIILGLYQLQDGKTSKERLDFLEPVIGLFHLQMNVLRVHMMNFWSPMLERYVTKFGNSKVKPDVPDFRAANFFYNDVLDGVLLGAFCSHESVNLDDYDQLSTFLDSSATARLQKERDEFRQQDRGNNADEDNGGNFDTSQPTASTSKGGRKRKRGDDKKKLPDSVRISAEFDWKTVAADIMDDLYNIEALHHMRYDAKDGSPIPVNAGDLKGGQAKMQQSNPAKGKKRKCNVDEPTAPDGSSKQSEKQARQDETLDNPPISAADIRRQSRRQPRVEEEDENISWPAPTPQNHDPNPNPNTTSVDPPEPIGKKRDVIFENNILFAREGLIYREYEDAVSCGDVGRIEKVIKYWAHQQKIHCDSINTYKNSIMIERIEIFLHNSNLF